MLFYNFGGYDGFKEIFELREHGNGVKSRRNAILLAFFKSPKILNWARKHPRWKLLEIDSMTKLFNRCIDIMCNERFDFKGRLFLKDRAWGSRDYKTDDFLGKTADGDARSIRYVRCDTGHVYKMKAGKMYRHLILNTQFGQILPEQVVTWLCEELASEWYSYNDQNQYTLHVDNNFKLIYTGRKCVGNFGSCMTDEDQHSFYEDSVKAKAAYLTNNGGYVVARAIIFTEVHDCDDPNVTLRLCERQYSTDGDNILKQILVNRLIDGKYIDGYKRVGADCHSPRSFIANDGTDLSQRRFYIDCTLDYDDTLSYQDTFKWYNMSKGRAYNTGDFAWQHDLSTTSSCLEDERNWDEYHEEYTDNDTVQVYYRGNWISCDEDSLDDFVEICGRWYHDDEVSYCDKCGEAYLSDDGWYSEITGENYCSNECLEEAEREYCEDYPDEYTWIEGEGAFCIDDVVTCPCCGNKTGNIHNFWHSRITDEYYCSFECQDAAEREYIESHPDCGYAICIECGDITCAERIVTQEDGTKICDMCHNINNDLRKYNLLKNETV